MAAPPRPVRPTAAGRGRRARLFLHELRALGRVAGPLVVSQLGNVAMGTTDTLMVAPLGAEALAAAGVGNAIQFTLLVIASGIVFGMTPLISQAFGAGDRSHARHLLVQGLWLALALSAPVVAVSLVGRPLSLALGQEPAVAGLAGGYLAALAAGAPAALLFTAFRQYLEGMGLTRPPMAITILGLAVNVLANWVLIYGVPGHIPAMGVVGSGWATTIVRWAMLLAMVAYLVVHPGLRPLAGVSRRPDPALLRRITVVGIPIGGQLGVEVSLFASAAIMMGWFGARELAAHQITINVASTTFMVALGASLGGSIRVGHHVGARRPRAVRRATLATYLVSLAFMGVCGIAFLAAPGPLVGLYTSDPAIGGLAARLLLVAAAFQLADGAQAAGLCALRGAADTRVPMFLATFGYWGVGLPAAWFLAFRTPLGPTGIWIGLALGLAVVAVLLAARVRRVLWKTTPRPAALPPVEALPAAY